MTDDIIQQESNEPTMRDVLGAINEVKTDVKGLKIDVAVLKTDVAGLKTDVKEMKTEMVIVKNDIAELKKKTDSIEEQVAGVSVNVTQLQDDVRIIKSNMVTKDDLGIKLAESEGNLKSVMSGEDKKVIKVVKLLEQKKVLSDKEAKEIYAMRPFPSAVS